MCELHLIHIFQVLIFLGQACSTKLISVHSNVQWDIGYIHIRTVGLLLLHCFFASWSDWEWQLGGGWCHCSFFATLCWDGRQQVRLTAGSQGAVVLGNGLLYCQVAVAGRDSYGFVFPARVTALLSCPFAPYPILMAFTPALTPASPRAGSAYEHMCVHPSSGCVHGPRPIRLASTDVTGLEEC